MTLSMSLLWKAPDSSALVNGRLKDVAAKGFVQGGDVTRVIGSLEVDVSSFVCVTNDGAVVRSNATERLVVADSVVSYVVLRARYVTLAAPILSLQTLDSASYLADPEIGWLHVLATVDLTAGGPHSDVPAASILYELRDEVDQQGRSSWRSAVANFGALPMPPSDHNRDGDVRITLDTRSLYVWQEATSTWDLFDEVPLTTHRLLEHSNGLVSGALLTSMAPSVFGTSDVVTGAVPVGPPNSGYTVAGKYVTAPAAPVTTSVLALLSRGLLQSYADEFGAIAVSYRAQMVTAPTLLNVRIVDIDDNHEVVAGMALTGTSSPDTLSWNGGSPVAVASGGRYRLYRPNGSEWIEVDVAGAVGAASETYDVLASFKTDSHFLIAHYFWNGSNQLILGTDRRVLGTLGAPELSSDLRRDELHPPLSDLRGNMVFSGGTVTTLAGLQVRVSGPLIAYIQGKRFVVPVVNGAERGFTGITLPDNTTSKLYVNKDGTFLIGTLPAFESYATIAEVVTAAGAVSVITDERDPQIIVGNATRVARVRWTGTDALEWDPANSRLTAKTGGFVTGTKFRVGTAELDALTVSGASIFGGAATFATTVAVTGAATFASTLGVTGAASFATTVAVTGAATFATTVAVTGAATFATTVAVTGAATFATTVAVTGAATFATTVAVTGAATFSSKINANNGIGRSTSGVLQVGFDGNTTSIQLGDTSTLSTVVGELRATTDGRINRNALTYKSSDESVTSSTVLQNDNHLSRTLPAIGRYKFKYVLIVTATGGGLTINLGSGTSVLSSQSSFLLFNSDNGTSGPLLNKGLFYGVGAMTTSFSNAVTGVMGLVIIEGFIDALNVGTFKLQWAQTISNVNTTTIHEGSYLEVEPVSF